MQNIKGILVSSIAPMENHIANGGEKLLGNASSIKKRSDGRVYISGQMQRHVFFSAVNRLNVDDAQKGNTYVANGDGIGNAIEVDLRADLGGFMHPSAGSYSGRRTAPLTVTPAVSLSPSQITRDLLVRMKVNTNDGSKDQALATKEQSDADMMLMNFFLDVSNLSISRQFSYEKGFHVNTNFVKHVAEQERVRRVRLFLEATGAMTEYANQALNATTGEPQKVLIVFDNKMSRKASRYFEASERERENILSELNARGVVYFIGDDTQGDVGVFQAYQNALSTLEKSTLFDPCGGDEQVQSFIDAFPESVKKNVDENE